MPAPITAVIAWVAAHPYEAIGLAWFLLSVVNGALPHKNATLARITDRLALLKRANSPGTLKLPFTASAPPLDVLADLAGAAARTDVLAALPITEADPPPRA